MGPLCRRAAARPRRFRRRPAARVIQRDSTHPSPQLAKTLLEKGDTVIATTRRPDNAAELQQLAAGAGAAALHVMALDASSPASIDEWAAALKASKIDRVDVRGGG